jgi:hypothetical protein
MRHLRVVVGGCVWARRQGLLRAEENSLAYQESSRDAKPRAILARSDFKLMFAVDDEDLSRVGRWSSGSVGCVD